MEIAKVGRKWIIKGAMGGWIFDKTFPSKWKAKIALSVYEKGGRILDYWEKARKAATKRPERIVEIKVSF